MLSGDFCEIEPLKATSGLSRSSELAENPLRVKSSKKEADKNVSKVFFIVIALII